MLKLPNMLAWTMNLHKFCHLMMKEERTQIRISAVAIQIVWDEKQRWREYVLLLLV